MSNTASGKYAKFISDRSGMEFPYKEMVKEWNGSRVHISEFEPKQPQLEPKPHTADPQGLKNARPARTEPQTDPLLPADPFIITSGSSGGLAYSVFENSSGFSITVTGTDNYTFNLGSTPTVSGRFGGMTVTAGPVTLTP